MEVNGRRMMCCPCRKCDNTGMVGSKEEFQYHLVKRGFTDGYTRWTSHSEDASSSDDDVDDQRYDENTHLTNG